MKIRHVSLSLAVLGSVLCALFCPSRTFADTVIYSNLGPGETYSQDGGTSILGSDSVFGSVFRAVPFTPSQTLDLSQILLPLTANGTTDSATVELVGDEGGLPGTTVLASWTVDGLPPFFSASTITPSQTLTSAPGVLLSAGSQYWIVVGPGTSQTSDTWNLQSGENGFSCGGSSGLANKAGTGWQVSGCPAYEVTGVQVTPTPEPSSLTMLGAALAAIALVGFSLPKNRITWG